MFAKTFRCTVTKVEALTPTVFRVFFKTEKKIKFEPGQFISVKIGRGKDAAWRCYSFANSREDAMKNGYELCIKRYEGGVGSHFLFELKVGDSFYARAPFGHYRYKPSENSRTAVFVATSTGIAPIRAILQSRRFQENRPSRVVLLAGFREVEEILYRGEFEKLGVETIYALSRPNEFWIGSKGRVTDVLQEMSGTDNWQATDFYICGNGEMVEDVANMLRYQYHVSKEQIHFESFSTRKKKLSSYAPTLLHKKVTA